MLALVVLVVGAPVLWIVLPRTDTALNIAVIPMLAAAVTSVGLGGVFVGAWGWWGRGVLLIAAGPAYVVVLAWMVLEGSGVGT